MKWWDRSWNPVKGCSKCSEGCDNCFVEKLIEKRKPYEKGLEFKAKFIKKALKYKFEDEFIQISSHGDLFHHDVEEKQIDEILNKVSENQDKRFAVLTKRSAYLKEYFNNKESTNVDNILFGVTVESNKRKYRIDDLLNCLNIKHRFICLEPLLEEVSIEEYLKTNKINWVIVGCETGEGYRECKIEWIKKIVTECKKYKVPVFVNNINDNGNIVEELEDKSICVREYYKDFCRKK